MEYLLERLNVKPKKKRFYIGIVTGFIGIVAACSSIGDVQIYHERIIAIAHHEARWKEDLSDEERIERLEAIETFFRITPPDAWKHPKSLDRYPVIETMHRFREKQIAYVNFYAHNPYEDRDRAQRDILLKGALSGTLLLFGGRSIIQAIG